MLGRLCSRVLNTNIHNYNNILCTSIRVRGVKQKVDVTYIKPEYPGGLHPLVSGDKEPAQLPDISEPLAEFTQLPEFSDIPEAIKPIFSIGYENSRRAAEMYITEMENRVRRHACDDSSDEVKTARLTARVRFLQHYMEQHPRNYSTAIFLKELIDKRNKLLRTLRKTDYKLYEYVLEKLDIEYKPVPENNQNPTRKGTLKKLVDMKCEEIRKQKIEEYKQHLIREKEKLLKEFAENPV